MPAIGPLKKLLEKAVKGAVKTADETVLLPSPTKDLPVVSTSTNHVPAPVDESRRKFMRRAVGQGIGMAFDATPLGTLAKIATSPATAAKVVPKVVSEATFSAIPTTALEKGLIDSMLFAIDEGIGPEAYPLIWKSMRADLTHLTPQELKKYDRKFNKFSKDPDEYFYEPLGEDIQDILRSQAEKIPLNKFAQHVNAADLEGGNPDYFQSPQFIKDTIAEGYFRGEPSKEEIEMALRKLTGE